MEENRVSASKTTGRRLMAKQRTVSDIFWEQFLQERPVLPRDSPEIFEGENTEICSFDDFLIHMSVPGKSNGLTYLRLRGYEAFKVFWYETKEDEPIVTISRERVIPRLSLGLSTKIQDRVKLSLMFAQTYSTDAVLFQFWAPIKAKSGETMLTISKQPFGFGELCNGLCRYKYYCMQQEYEEQYGQYGPPARVFKRGIREDCRNIMHYSTQEFPTRDYAIQCGIVSYWALPLFEPHASQHCVGVLEYFSLDNYDFNRHEYPVKCAAKEFALGFPCPHYHECDKIRRDILSPRVEIKKVLKAVREAHQLPLIQVWVPCMCDDDLHQALSSDKLFCDMRICSGNLKCLSEFEKFRTDRGTFFVKRGEGLVGRAFSENSPCLFSDTSQLSLSDSPFAHLTRSAGLAACFVIPLKLVHPMLDAMFLEIFLPTQGSGNSKVVLKSLLFTLAKEFSKLNAAVGLKQNEEFQVMTIHSDSNEFDYFYIDRRSNVNVEMSLPVYHDDPNAKVVTTAMAVDHFSLDVLKEHTNQQDVTDSSRQVTATMPEDHSSLDILKQHPNSKDATDGISREVIAAMEILKPCFGNIIDAVAQDLGEDTTESSREVTAEEQVLLDLPCNAQDLQNAQGTDAERVNLDSIAQDTLYPSREVITGIAEDQITMDVLKPYFGNIIDAAAKDLGVSRSTLKRRCRALGIKRWPWHKRNIVRHIQSNPRLRQSLTQNYATEKEAPHSPFQTQNNAADREAVPSSSNVDRIHQSYDMIGKATYGGDTVMFPLKSNSGIKELHKELNQRFQLQAEQFKIKYKYEDEWILIICDQDLHLGLEMINSTGGKTINLSISTLSTS